MNPDEISPDELVRLARLGQRMEEVECQLAESRAYVERLVETSKILPRDVALLREANGRFAEENFQLRRMLRQIHTQLGGHTLWVTEEDFKFLQSVLGVTLDREESSS